MVTLGDDKEVTRLLRKIGTAIRSEISSNYRHGKDALGAPGSVRPRTLVVRQYDKEPPKKPRTDRYQRRFPERGSRGGKVPLNSSGLMSKSVKTSIIDRGAAVKIAVRGNRWRVVNALHGKYPNIFGIDPKHADELAGEVTKLFEVKIER